MKYVQFDDADNHLTFEAHPGNICIRIISDSDPNHSKEIMLDKADIVELIYELVRLKNII
jgi:hypothetical protein